MTHEEKVNAYSMGWGKARNPSDKRFHVAAPKHPVLADYFYQGYDDARRSLLVGGAA